MARTTTRRRTVSERHTGNDRITPARDSVLASPYLPTYQAAAVEKSADVRSAYRFGDSTGNNDYFQ
jgi:hypothetical protein